MGRTLRACRAWFLCRAHELRAQIPPWDTVARRFSAMLHNDVVSLITVPLFSGAIGYATNWSGIWMLFYPVRFAGKRVPGLPRLANVFPRRIQQIPGVMIGGIGWQGGLPPPPGQKGRNR